MALSFINTSGNIISEDFCSQLLIENKADYVKSKSFGDDVKKVDEDIATTFELLRERWEEIRSRILEDQLDTTQLRDRWIKPFLSMLDYEPVYNSHNLKNNAGVDYHIPYRGWDAEEAPLIHMVHSSADFDSRDKSNRTHPNKSPHDLLQQYLNTSSHSWAILINGRKIRILRDFYHSITKGFIEFDVEGIFETANTEQFRILYRMMHSSRFIGQFEKTKSTNDGEDTLTCLLEKFHSLSRETGVRVGDNLRKQVRIAIETLGNGFAENLNPDDIDESKEKKFYSETLNIIYRLLFLLFAEQKGWLPVKNDIYARTYSINALRERAEKAEYSHDNNEDLWEGLKVTFRLVTKGYTFPNGDSINAFGGQLFSDERIFHIKSPLKNKHLLKAIDALCFFTDNKLKYKINYATLAIDELGSVYESLLDYEPRLLKENTEINGRLCKRGEFVLDDRSTERKTTGSYYTDSRLVAQLIDSALVPVIENVISEKSTDDEKRLAILALKVADIACGSGAFLIAALEKMGEYLSFIGKAEGEKPTEQELRHAKREVLQNCIYGVDLNPMALELAKFSLWITASMPNLPLSFLDHKLKCGNSLIGATPELIKKGIPEEAFNPVTLDDKTVCSELKKRVKKELEAKGRKDRGIQMGFDFKATAFIETDEDSEQYQHILNSQQEDAEEVENLAIEYAEVYKAFRENTDWKLADTWTAAFFIQKDDLNKIYPTNVTLQNIKQGNAIDEVLESEILRLAHKYHFFHWHLEFPEVFEKGGFDCILGNPPWEKIKIQEKEFFSIYDHNIANAETKNTRSKLIENLRLINSPIYNLFQEIKSSVEHESSFYRLSNKFRLGNSGDINLFALFAELYIILISKTGKSGFIAPPGIATDDTYKSFIKFLIKKNILEHFLNFTNRGYLFHAVESTMSFALYVFSNSKSINYINVAAKIWQVEHLSDNKRIYHLFEEDIVSLNPNTQNLPIFENSDDAKLVKKIYSDIPVFQNEVSLEKNSWHVKFGAMLHMTNDSELFKILPQLESEGFEINDNYFVKGNQIYTPVYESKLINQYNHRAATFEGIPETKKYLRKAATLSAKISNLKDVNWRVQPRYWIDEEEINKKIPTYWKHNWLIGYRNAINVVADARSTIFTIIPKYGVGNSLPLLYGELSAEDAVLLVANFNSFILDYVTRQKASGGNLNFYVVKQLPIIEKTRYTNQIKEKILINAAHLIINSKELKELSWDLGLGGDIFQWSNEERFTIQCELDAIYAHLYNIEKVELNYIMETFPIVKKRDIEKFGTYRTKDTILRLFDEMEWVKVEMDKNKTLSENSK